MRFIVSLLATILVVCGVNAGPDIDPVLEMWNARDAFTASLLPELDHRARQKNVILSSFGLHSALSSVLIGSEGKTYSQLRTLLGYGQTHLDKKAILDVYKQTFENMTSLPDLGLNFANLFVVDNELELKDEFKNGMIQSFGAGLLKEDFINQPEKATKDINTWVNQTTQGKIPKLFDSTLDKNTRAVLANALHFKSKWRSQFDEKLNFVGNFTFRNFTTKNVTYMTIPAHQLKDAKFRRSFGFKTLQVPFDTQGRLWFGILLADLGGDENLDCCTEYTSFIRSSYKANVKLTLPKFDITQAHSDLKSVLQTLGVTDLFDKDLADLSPIDGNKDLYVSDVAHKATFSIDENGAEGAAATGVVIGTKSAIFSPEEPIDFFVNRPFIFTVYDSLTNVDYFTGIIYDP